MAASVSSAVVKPNTALDRLNTSVALLDAGLRFVYANPAFVDLTGLVVWRDSPLEVIGDAAPALRELIERMHAAQSTLAVRGFELATRDPPLHVDIAVSAGPDGGVLLEMHAQGQPESVLAAPRISQSLRGLAHEVKNPLAGLRGAAQLLLRRASEPDQQRLAELIITEADRLDALTDRLLRPGEPHLSAVNLHESANARARVDRRGSRATAQARRDYDPSCRRFAAMPIGCCNCCNSLRNAMQAAAGTIVARAPSTMRWSTVSRCGARCV